MLELGGNSLEEVRALFPLALEELAEEGEFFIPILLCVRGREEPEPS